MEKQNKWKPEFQKRFDARYDELQWLYYSLYGEDENALGWLVSAMVDFYEERNTSLKKLDREREKNPDWYKGNDMLGMMMYSNLFADTLQGVRKKLDYIRGCGVNYLHLMPLLDSPEGKDDGGYAVSDFRKVKPELGTMEDLEQLTADCHKAGISVALDFVMNHTSEEHIWAKCAREGDAAARSRYYFYDRWDIPTLYEKTMPEVFPTTAPGNFTWLEDCQQIVMTTFYPYQWDLNYANPTVFNDMTENMLFLCNQGVDIVRLDAVPYIWKELGTKCRNLPQVHTLVRLMRMVCEVVCPGTLLLGEVVMEPSKVVPYFGTVEKPECHLLYNVTTMATTWHTVATQDVRLLEHQLGQVFALPKQYTFLNYLRCHDDIGWGLDFDYLGRFGMGEVPHKKYLNDYFTGRWPGSPSRGELYNDDPRLGDARLCGTTASLCGIEAAKASGDQTALAQALSLDEMLHAYMFTLSGIPVLYSGDEIAQENDNAYHADPLKAPDSRFLHRGDMDWEKAKNRSKKRSVEGRIFHFLRKMETLRQAHRVFDAQADTWIIPTGDSAVLGVGRYHDGEKLVALFNFSGEEKAIPVTELGEFCDLLTGRKKSKKAVKVPAKGFVWLLCDFSAEV